MSQSRPENITTPTSDVVLTSWMDTPGVRHHALTMDATCGDRMLCNVFTPCMGFIENALDNCDDVSPVTCFLCLMSDFERECRAMNLDAIEDLDEADLVDHFVDRDALAPWING